MAISPSSPSAGYVHGNTPMDGRGSERIAPVSRLDIDDRETTAPSGRSQTTDPLTTVTYVLLFLLSLGLLAWGVFLAAENVTWSVLAAGAVSTVLVLAAWPISRALARSGSNTLRLAEAMEDQIRPMRHDLSRALVTLNAIEENGKISELAKRVAYREKDRDAIWRAVEEDLLQGDYAGARTLADEMEKAFGYENEAERFREEIRNRQSNEREREIDDARIAVDRLCSQERWVDAFHEADRVINRFGGDMQVRLLRTRIEERRQNKKVELVKAFHEAVALKDVDTAMDLIRRLDLYLTPDEGRQLSESAREVFKGKLIQLRDNFMAAMQQHDFSEAIRVGQIIRRDFPNSQLAREVRQHEPRIREAAGVAPDEA